MDTTAVNKRMRAMDKPIYLEFILDNEFSIENLGKRWAVIEEKDETNKAQAEGELGDELMIHNNGMDRVRGLHLPNLDPTIYSNCIAAAGSRLFVIGGYSNRLREQSFSLFHQRPLYNDFLRDNQILQIDLEQSHPYWERSITTDEHPIKIPKTLNSWSAVAFSEDGDWIYVVGFLKVVRFHRLDVDRRNSFPDLPPTPVPPRLLGITASSKILLLWRSPDAVQLRSYDLESGSLQIIDASLPWCEHDASSVALVRDSYLICFAHCLPVIKDCPHPALYVYDLGRHQWLPEPVQGLPNNGIAFPLYEDEVSFSSLMQVRRAELKLALLWTFQDMKTEVHWSKFTLAIQENVDQDIAPTFHAESLYSGACVFPSDTGCMINCTAG